VKDDLMVPLIEPECGWCKESLPINGCGDMPYFGFLEKCFDPGIVACEMRSALKGGGILADIVTWHTRIIPLPFHGL
jgi:hypothetical protein